MTKIELMQVILCVLDFLSKHTAIKSQPVTALETY